MTAEKRLEIAARILAGLAANPSIYAPDPQIGWRLINCGHAEIAGEAVALADALMMANEHWEKHVNVK